LRKELLMHVEIASNLSAARSASNSRGRTGLLAAVVAIAGLAALASAQAPVVLPLRPVAGPAGEPRLGMQTIAMDAAEYERLREFNAVLAVGVPRGTGAMVDLELTRVEPFAADARIVVAGPGGEVEIPRPDAQFFTGSVVGATDSRVFLALSPSGVSGYIVTGNETSIISSGPQGLGETVVYNASGPAAAAMQISMPACAGELVDPGAEIVPPNTGEVGEGGGYGDRAGECRVFRIALETDQEFLADLFGGNQTSATTYVGTLYAAMNDIYTRDVNAAFEISYLRLWSTEDPWTSTTTSSQLGQYRTYWNGNMASVTRDLGHYLSGRGLGGGVAYLSAACGSNAYGLSANLGGFFPYPLVNNSGQNWDIMVVAHEVGHNLGSRHTHDPNGYNPPVDGCGNAYLNPPGVQDCTAADLNIGTIMSYCHICPGGMSNMRMEFGPRVSQVIRTYIDNRPATCGLFASVSIGTQPLSQEACIGEPLTLTVAATGVGQRKFQWRRNGVNINGAINPTYTISTVSASNVGTFDCVVTAGCASATSEPAVVTAATCPADPCDYDYNQDENVDLLDAQQMAQVFVGLLTPGANWLSGDLNNDENADLTDAQLLATFVVTGNCGL
jgi:hypothetical protein